MQLGFIRRPLAILATLLLALPALAAPRGAKGLSRAQDLGASNSSKVMNISVWLKMHQPDVLAQTVSAQQDAASASFQQWTDSGAVNAKFAPTAAEVREVQSFLSSRGLKVTGIGPQNAFVSATGTAAQVQSAFGVQMHDFRLAGQTFSSNTTKPSLPASVKPLVSFVGGLNDFRPHPMNRWASDPDGPGRFVGTKLSAAPNGLIFSASCFRAPQAVHFTSADADAFYFGNRYGTDITNTDPGTVAPCGYQPSEIADAYNLDKLYQRNLDGRGQTVAIVDAFGSITIQQDVDTFSQAMGLPPADLTIIGTPTESDFSGSPNAGWADETTLDVEWVHAIAPGAKIILVVTPDNSFDNLFAGIITASQQPGVTAISNSWGNVELATDPEFRAATDAVFQSIAAKGISVHFSSGDDGDEAINLGMADADWPASSPFVTAIGGISLSLNRHQEIAFQTAWGNNITEIADTIALGSPPLDPVNNEGFQGGGGGGISDVYAKPSFQRHLPGSRRMVPDISWLADPFTGVEIVITGDAQGDQFIGVIGGTSLSCPMFSGLWAIASQRAGHKLGQAAASIYNLGNDAITDVRTVGSPADVSGVIHDAGGIAIEVPSDLAAPLQNVPDFFSALYNSPFSTRWFVLTFGTDSTLAAGNGYDLATGLGTPNPPAFVDSFAPRGHH